MNNRLNEGWILTGAASAVPTTIIRRLPVVMTPAMGRFAGFLPLTVDRRGRDLHFLHKSDERIQNRHGHAYKGLDSRFQTMISTTRSGPTKSVHARTFVKIVGVEVPSIFFRLWSSGNLSMSFWTISAAVRWTSYWTRWIWRLVWLSILNVWDGLTKFCQRSDLWGTEDFCHAVFEEIAHRELKSIIGIRISRLNRGFKYVCNGIKKFGLDCIVFIGHAWLQDICHFSCSHDTEICQHSGDLVKDLWQFLYDWFKLHCLVLVFHQFDTDSVAFSSLLDGCCDHHPI